LSRAHAIAAAAACPSIVLAAAALHPHVPGRLFQMLWLTMYVVARLPACTAVMPPRQYLSVGAAVLFSASSPAKFCLKASGRRLFSTSPSRLATGAHVRSEFTSFFKSKGHLHVPSSRCEHPPTPTSPTLLLTFLPVWFHKTHLSCCISPPPPPPHTTTTTTPTAYIYSMPAMIPPPRQPTPPALQVYQQRHGAVQTSVRRRTQAACSDVRFASEVRQGRRQTQRPRQRGMLERLTSSMETALWFVFLVFCRATPRATTRSLKCSATSASAIITETMLFFGHGISSLKS
jgi:hypothetical protein